MKLWITTKINPFESSDYKVLSPLNGESPFDIDKFADDGECEEIVLEDILSFVPFPNIKLYLQKAASKLAHNGRLIVSGTDVLEVCKEYYFGRIALQHFNELVLGDKSHAWAFKQSGITLFEVRQYLSEIGLQIIQQKLPYLEYSITAKRN